MSKKYQLLENDTIEEDGQTLYRIQALRDIPDVVKRGELGGYVTSESNLSHEGDCWVGGNAQIRGEAEVSDNAQVSGKALVFGNARVFGSAHVFGNAGIRDNARVFGYARISDYAQVYKKQEVT